MTDNITNEDLKQIEAAAKKATEGPWIIEDNFPERIVSDGENKNGVYVTSVYYNTFSNGPANANFIALTDPDTILAMIARIREAEGQKPPCSPHCYHHQTHPCEKCGRISGYLPIVLRQAENIRLRKALARYGRHTPACKHIMEHNKNINCSCGYGKAMKSETPERR